MSNNMVIDDIVKLKLATQKCPQFCKFSIWQIFTTVNVKDIEIDARKCK